MNDAGKKVVLVLDDDEDMVLSLRMVLENADREIKCYTDPIRALANLNLFCPDLIIVDLLMPNIEGEDFVRAAQLKYHNIKILIISALHKSKIIAASERLGVPSLTKPFDVCELETQVEEMLK